MVAVQSWFRGDGSSSMENEMKIRNAEMRLNRNPNLIILQLCVCVWFFLERISHRRGQMPNAWQGLSADTNSLHVRAAEGTLADNAARVATVSQSSQLMRHRTVCMWDRTCSLTHTLLNGKTKCTFLVSHERNYHLKAQLKRRVKSLY